MVRFDLGSNVRIDMTSNDQIARLNAHKPPFIELLNGKIIAADNEAQSCTFEFRPTTDHCHSVDVVQGGFITVMPDAAMSHAVFAHLGPGGVVALASLEVTTRYHAVSAAAKALFTLRAGFVKPSIRRLSWSQNSRMRTEASCDSAKYW